MTDHLKVPVASLKLDIDIDSLTIPKISRHLDTILGQSRAQSALEFGVAMKNPGYNIFVMGAPGTGRLSMITNYLSRTAEKQEAPPSYAYVDNFNNAREPISIQLPAGQGQKFSDDVEQLIDNLLATFPAAFESPSYQQKKSAIERRFNQQYNAAIDLVDKKAEAMSVALFRESDTITFLPIRDNKALNEDQFTMLPQLEREAFHKHTEELEAYLGEVLLELPQWRRTMVDETKQLDIDTIGLAIDPLFDELNKQYQNTDDIISYLAELKKDVVITITDFLMPTRVQDIKDNTTKRLILTEQYMPNILVDDKSDNGAPVIYESHPTYQNLFGRIEYMSDQGALITTYRRICSGSLHKANGGYLILDAEKILTYPFVWEGLKRALKADKIEIESPYSEYGVNTITLKPEVIPLNIKVILVGSRDMYYLLEEMDSEFNEMFRVLADFDNHIKITDDSIEQFVILMVTQASDSGSLSLTKSAIARLIEHSCRLSENQSRLSARINDSLEIIGEANLLCSGLGLAEIDKPQIELALSAKEARSGRIAGEVLEEMIDGTILIDTEGESVGKVNGLTVMEVGGSSFGAPARITTTVYPGSRGIVDIEREAELGQAIHSKGVMILTGYLGHCYAQQFSLAISASIALEQSYGHVDGDSASLAELCCLISALTHTPIKQCFAITGSINQYGEVQAIGGVNEKIEGFFKLCQARGLNGQHAVIIPVSNKRNLMLKQQVIDAVAEGLFNIYVVSNVNETLELLMAKKAGEMDREGNYPEGTINYEVVSRLKEISEMDADDEEESDGDE
ncbi:MAG: AAA family ATPase [Methylococcales bacterium]|nr:AAA family ATPase [Methylococcales bacterium]